jgi:hypothetical protein
VVGPNLFADHRTTVAMETVSRMASMLYSVDIKNVCRNLDNEEFRSSIRGYDAAILLQGFVDHLMKRVCSLPSRRIRPHGRPVTELTGCDCGEIS